MGDPRITRSNSNPTAFPEGRNERAAKKQKQHATEVECEKCSSLADDLDVTDSEITDDLPTWERWKEVDEGRRKIGDDQYKVVSLEDRHKAGIVLWKWFYKESTKERVVHFKMKDGKTYARPMKGMGKKFIDFGVGALIHWMMCLPRGDGTYGLGKKKLTEINMVFHFSVRDTCLSLLQKMHDVGPFLGTKKPFEFAESCGFGNAIYVSECYFVWI